MQTHRSPYGPVEIARDALGYPRIRAKDALGGAWGRGFMHATDRLVQAHLMVFVASGRMMEILGDRPATRLVDRATRHLELWRGLAAHERSLAPESRQQLEGYLVGF